MHKYRHYRSGRSRYRGEHGGGMGKIILLFAIIIGVVFVLEAQLKPMIESLTENEAKQAAIASINRTVEQELSKDEVGYADLVNIERTDSGQVLSITTNMSGMNLLKSKLTQAIQDNLAGEHIQVGVPIGTLMGNDFLHGRGPEIPLMVTLTGNVETNFDSNFESAGINQTRHQIYLKIHTSIYSFLPGIKSTTDIETNVAVAETIIVGEVPQLVAGLPSTSIQNALPQV